ncbi:DUF4007 family protein [Seonamhaeicola aphaedonensis]|uniref:Uncharacterized protein DUF4007 n=1 Tax=Seonamhaeicola aphaedonensis TaxID=1461338 RepID=A0A3D9H5F0_9FLAO|nr:DUF4007 family protein [Seonamhaeicola aphaedonensis]RED44714.1 uncharacterized protein DUF4007 [Seonamhaeicola aphaedonensis]
MSERLMFSGHETFHCKGLWLKKGYDFVKVDGKFTDQACIDLGVGRNMVSSIRFWLKAFNIINTENEKVTKIANFLFDEIHGKDKYLENETSLWLLHYLLIINDYSSIYSIIFNEFRKLKPEFSKENFITYIDGIDSGLNHNTLSKDFSVFLRTYHSKNEKDIEDSFSGILSDLELVQEIKRNNSTKYTIQNNRQEDIPIELILFIILENDGYGKSISFKNLYSDYNSVGNIFAFSKEQLEKKLILISEKYNDIVYSNDSGIKELQFKNVKPNSFDILSQYYD